MMTLLKLAYRPRGTRRRGNDFVRHILCSLRCFILSFKHDIGSQNVFDPFQNGFTFMQHTLVAVSRPVVRVTSHSLRNVSLTDATMPCHESRVLRSVQLVRPVFHGKTQSWDKQVCMHQTARSVKHTCPPTTP